MADCKDLSSISDDFAAGFLAHARLSSRSRRQGMKYYIEGYIHSTQIRRKTDEVLIIDAKWYHSMRKSEKPTSLCIYVSAILYIRDLNGKPYRRFFTSVTSMGSRIGDPLHPSPQWEAVSAILYIRHLNGKMSQILNPFSRFRDHGGTMVRRGGTSWDHGGTWWDHGGTWCDYGGT